MSLYEWMSMWKALDKAKKPPIPTEEEFEEGMALLKSLNLPDVVL